MKVGNTNVDFDPSMYAGAWMIDEVHAKRMIESLSMHDWSEHVRAYQAAMSQGEANGQRREPKRIGKVAVVEISGAMSKHGSSLSESGSTIAARAALRQARADFAEGKVGSTVIVWDSPGGTVAGTADLAADVRRTAALMPTFSLGEDMVASAAIWGASQASKFYLSSPTTNAGSLGAVLVIDDVSEAFKQKGVKTKVYKTGALKAAGVPGTELGKAEDEYFSKYVQAMFEPFAADFKASRQMSDEQFDKIADGRVFVGAEAVSLGLADGIKSFDEVLAEAEAAILSERPEGAKAMAENERKAASLAELEKIEGASAEFVLRQIKAGATIGEASAAHLQEREAELKVKLEDLDKREKALKEKEAGSEATTNSNVTLEQPVKQTNDPGQSGSAVVRFNRAKSEKVSAGMSPQDAHAAVCLEQPTLAEEFMRAEAETFRNQYPSRYME